jgi:hypothetical protein
MQVENIHTEENGKKNFLEKNNIFFILKNKSQNFP